MKLATDFAYEFERKCKGLTALNENMRLSELVEWYFDNYAANELKEITAYNYHSQLKNHVLPTFGNYKIKDISTPKITALFKSLGMSNALSKKLYITMQSVFTRAVEQGFLHETPCKNVILPKDKIAKEKKPPLDENQVKRLLGMVEDYSVLNCIVKVLLFTGMRSGECLGLRWEDIDFEHKLIYIKHTLTDVGGRHWLTSPKTKTSIRTVAMSDVVKTILLEHKEEQEKRIAYVGKSFVHTEMVFTSEIGNFKDRSALNTGFKRFLKGSEFEYITLHSLRHANATLLLNNGVDLKIVSEHLGHSGVGVTADIYSDVLESTKRRVADLISLTLK